MLHTYRTPLALASVVMLVVMSFSGKACAETRQDPGQVKALFSADDTLCEPLAAIYGRLLREHGPGRHMVLDWERQYPSWFKNAGLVRPPQVSNVPAPDLDFGDGVRVFYRADLTGDGHQRLVYIDDNCVGRCDEFSTTTWILKPNAESRLVERSWPDGGGQMHTWRLFDPTVIEAQIAFHLRPPKPTTSAPADAEPIYPETYAKIFDRSLGQFVDQTEWSRVAKEVNDAKRFEETVYRFVAIVGGSGPFIQQIWLHNGQTLFTARSYPSDVLVYRYTNVNNIDAVCFLAPVK